MKENIKDRENSKLKAPELAFVEQEKKRPMRQKQSEKEWEIQSEMNEDGGGCCP